jgi:hypothetical protein
VVLVQGHTAEIVSLNFNQHGNQIITGSFDHTVKVWDTRTGRVIHTLAGHHGEISSTQYNYAGDLCISGSIDRTCKIWDVNKGTCVQVRACVRARLAACSSCKQTCACCCTRCVLRRCAVTATKFWMLASTTWAPRCVSVCRRRRGAVTPRRCLAPQPRLVHASRCRASS